jgi:hypothetical protein
MRHIVHASALMLCTLALGCASEPVGHELEGAVASSPNAIVGGTKATAYPESILVNMSGGYCSGALIAPRVVLTAGHCVAGESSWSVVAPFAQNQQARVLEGKTLDYTTNPQGYVNTNQHDVGLLYLDRAISLSQYPTLQRAKLTNGTSVVNIGRIQSGTLSTTSLFVSAPLTVSDATSAGFPYDYIANEIIESGDSGGPVELAGASHTIVAVNSGAGGGTEVLARVDLVTSWIDSYVNAHGGYASVATPAPSPTPAPTPAPAPSCASPEREPNNSYTAATAFTTKACGALTASDQDWFSWTVGAGTVNYQLQLVATGDAKIKMWKLVNGQYVQIANDTATSFTKQSTAAGTYVVGVWSASGAAQSYGLTLTK